MNLKVVKNTRESVLLEVIFEDKIDQMSNSGFTGKEKFIKITKGQDHTITKYDIDAKPYVSFTFGVSGYTLISDELEICKMKVLRFLLTQHIQIRNMTDKVESDIKIFFPKRGVSLSTYNNYQVHLGGEFAINTRTEHAIEEIFGKYEVIRTYVAPTGVTVYAKLSPILMESL